MENGCLKSKGSQIELIWVLFKIIKLSLNIVENNLISVKNVHKNYNFTLFYLIMKIHCYQEYKDLKIKKKTEWLIILSVRRFFLAYHNI